MNRNYLWLCITKDKYELPIAVADTAEELGHMLGVSPKMIRATVYRQRIGKVVNSRYLKIRV